MRVRHTEITCGTWFVDTRHRAGNPVVRSVQSSGARGVHRRRGQERERERREPYCLGPFRRGSNNATT